MLGKFIKAGIALMGCSSESIYYERLSCYIRKIVKNKFDAEDVLHDSYIKYEVKFNNYIDEEKTKNFLYCVAANESKNKLKFNKRHQSIDIEVVKENLLANDSDPFFIASDTTRIIHDEINKLPDNYKNIISLMAKGFTQKEISKITNINESTIRTRVERGRELLRKKLSEKDILY